MTKMFTFTNAGYSAMHVMYSFWDENSFVAMKEYQIRENLTNMYLKRCNIMCEKQAVTCRMHVGAMWG
jgi:hypothetical protein